MAKVDIGEKVVCPECEVKFYDLTKNPATCPKCAHSFDPAMIAQVAPIIIEPEEVAKPEKTDEEEETDEAEAEAKELELDGDNANFGGGDGDDGDDEDGGKSPDMDGFSTTDADEEDAALASDDDDDDLPPTGDEDDAEEVEI
ncbi:MAG: TIGR02300 family protein [Robiginitomaculum sp.]